MGLDGPHLEAVQLVAVSSHYRWTFPKALLTAAAVDRIRTLDINMWTKDSWFLDYHIYYIIKYKATYY